LLFEASKAGNVFKQFIKLEFGKIIKGIYLHIIKFKNICAYFVKITFANGKKTHALQN